MASRQARARARVVGALIAILGLFVLHRVADGFIDSSAVVTLFQVSVLAMILAACVILVGLIVFDLGRPDWALPIAALSSVVIVLATLPLLIGAFITLRSDDPLAPFLFFAVLALSLGILLMVLAGQAKAEVDQLRRRPRR